MQGRNSVLRDFQRFMLKSLTQEINVMENASRPLRRPALITLAERLLLALQPLPAAKLAESLLSQPSVSGWKMIFEVWLMLCKGFSETYSFQGIK